MTENSRQAHWQNVYASKAEKEVSWFQQDPAISLELIAAAGAPRQAAIIDIGAGASRLIDALLAREFEHLTALDISANALAVTKARLGPRAATVRWVVTDITLWDAPEPYDLWHDRAAFHFLTDESDRQTYIERLSHAVRPGGYVIIGTFAPTGPGKCSGLPVMRYDAAALARLLGSGFELIESRPDAHRTPWGSTQAFQFSRFRKTL